MKMIDRIFRKAKNDLIRTEIEEYSELYNKTLQDWLINHHKDIVFDKMKWQGVRILKNPMDLWIYQEILFETRPEVIIEIGSANGGTTLFLAHMSEIISEDGSVVISIDIDRSNYKVSHPRIKSITGDSLSDSVFDEVAGYCAGRKVLIIHDADHTEESVYANLVKYGSLVTSGSYFIVEDGIIDLFSSTEGIGGHPGPLRATKRYLLSNSDFEIDVSRERYWLTYNPKGFLRRK